MKYAVLLILGLGIGYLVAQYFQHENTIIETVTETKIDTVFVEIRDTIRITRTEIKHEYLRDTFLLEPIKPEIKAFKASFPFLYGNAYLEGEVLGEVLKTSLRTDFKLPTITNTITNTTTIIKKPSGLFLTAGAGNNFSTPYIGAIFIKNKFLIGLNTSGAQVGYKLGR
tara:strand:+ start:8773 stop:9279 length:507 start_codon:yes stop_codon:yes gene_type:complete